MPGSNMLLGRATVPGSTWPAPMSNGSAGVSPSSLTTSWRAVVIRADFTADGDQSGWAWSSRAIRPATCGADIEVPEIDWNSCPGRPSSGVGVLPARMLTPGAVTSGLITSAEAGRPTGPREEKSAMTDPWTSTVTAWVIAAVASSPAAAM